MSSIIKQRNRIIFLATHLSLLLFISNVWAGPSERMEISSSLNPVGSGARALGMGGAFIAIADDATAASWNPGGLIQLETPEMSAAYGYFRRKEDNAFRDQPDASNCEGVRNDHLNYLSIAYPFEINKPEQIPEPPFIKQSGPRRNMILSLNYQHMYDFYREWRYPWKDADPFFQGLIQNKYRQKGELYALGLAYCVQITPDLSVGVTLNYWGDFLYKNRWQQTYHHQWNIIYPGGVSSTTTVDKKESFSFRGWNAVFGFLWRISEHWTLGGVFKTPFSASITHNEKRTKTELFPDRPDLENPPEITNETSEEKMYMPMSYGIGVAYRFSDEFTISGDIYRTHWNDFEWEKENEETLSPITGKAMADSDISPTTWFRLGAEYLIVGKKIAVPLRAGVFYDPAPAESSPDDYCGFSLGTGLVYEPFVFDVAYQLRFGNNVGSSLFRGADFSQDMREHTVYASLIVYF